MADIPSALKDWSATAASNSPNDNTTIGSGLADNLQALQAVVRGDLATKGSDIASSAAPDVGAVQGLYHDLTGSNTVTGLGSTASAGIWKILQVDAAPVFIHSTALALPGAATIQGAAGDVGMFFCEATNIWRCVSYNRASGDQHFIASRYRLGSVRAYTATDTWTKPAGCSAAYVQVQAPGGGGGGADSDGTGVGGGGGGGAGGYTEKFITSGLSATEAITIGSVGAAGAAANGTTGGTGGTTSFGGHCTATGGVGGEGTGVTTTGSDTSAGGLGGAGSNGTVNVSGGAGGHGFAINGATTTMSVGGLGGSSRFGGGGVAGSQTAAGAGAAGSNGLAYGSGGGGASANANTTGAAGGTGGPGIVIVYEFY